MKFENLVFQNKSRKGNRGARNYAYPNVSCSSVKAGGSRRRVVFTFRACDTLYSSNNYCCYAIAGNRIYFMFCGESDSAYKLTKVPGSAKLEKRQLGIQYNKETSKFISSKEYTPKLDNECGLWYIEY